MGFSLPHILAFLTLTLVASHAALPHQLYWNSVLPNSKMPRAIRTSPAYRLGKPGGTNVNVGKGGVHVEAGKGKPGAGTNPGKRTNVGAGKGGVSGHKGKLVYVGVKPGPNPFDYRYAATETQLHQDPNAAIFFLEKDMQPGTTMNLHFTTNSNTATFVSRKTTESIPFSSNKPPEIFNQFSVKPGSVEADIIKGTIQECENPGIREDKYCPTSLESMIDFSTSKLGGGNIRAISTEAGKGATLQKYTIASGVKKLVADKSVVCHKQNYAYAVFYCHATKTTTAYVVPLKGADGVNVKAVVVCHTDTSEWNPKHLAFQVLKVKPGTVPVCHFLPSDHVVWVPNQKST
ncbi:dehydration-responsive protein RD22 [Pyrus ussuriensis x Pyrus communis]|uniref:Dehydration-responsive protein RD22 n=1 Tax=Pyrus ussuriensis x Pyrus communis TaxID=2448454 RepID=A0A5N5HTL3_9ROSA|nr:dehydration-responsive protein RD22 [Pyrus ussuriensis x Pyrus communis]